MRDLGMKPAEKPRQSSARHSGNTLGIAKANGRAEIQGVLAQDGSTKAKIERGALGLFVAHGVDGVSVKEIANSAGITDAAIYRHYASKAALAEGLMLAIHDRLTRLVRDVAAQDAPFRAQITALVNAYCQAADADWQLFAYHLLHLHHFPELFAGGSGDKGAKRDSPVTACADMITGAIERGETKPGNVELLAAMTLGVVLQAASAKAYMRLRGSLSIYASEFDKAVWAILSHR